MQTVTLNNGVKMPIVGFGVYQIQDEAACRQSVLDALAAGYRLLDTAAVYGNERAVGEAIRQSGLPREEIFLTTKLWPQDAGYEPAKAAIEASLARLGTDYLDLYLIHEPMGDVYGSWRAMEEAYRAGKIRAIGVSNVWPDRLVDLAEHFEVCPAVNQVETHPFFQQREAAEVMREYGICHEAWGSFAEGRNGIFTHPVLSEIGRAHGKNAAQVALRWLVERGIVALSKTTHRARMQENLDIFDFALSEEEMGKIAALDTGRPLILDTKDPKVVRRICGHRYAETKEG